MSSRKPVACELRLCQRYRGIAGPPGDPVHVCQAFPLGIPDSVLLGQNLHNKSIKGDEGLLYKPPREGEPQDWRAKLS